ncbi:MAG: cupin domain-containing protein [Nakamurella sp.]
MTQLPAGSAFDPTTIGVEFEPIDQDQVRSGSPQTRYLDVDETDHRTIGVWEHTAGVSTDVEVDEVFVVLAGSGSLAFEGPVLPSIDLRPGTIVRLTAGMRTVWTITETLRKVYIA